MKQIFHPYHLWEDWQNGMWHTGDKARLQEAIEFTGDHLKYGKAMNRVINEWPFACEHFLSNPSINRKAWIGHAAVCLELGIAENITRTAWGYLTEKQQNDANLQAHYNILLWERKQRLNNMSKHGKKEATNQASQTKPLQSLSVSDLFQAIEEYV